MKGSMTISVVVMVAAVLSPSQAFHHSRSTRQAVHCQAGDTACQQCSSSCSTVEISRLPECCEAYNACCDDYFQACKQCSNLASVDQYFPEYCCASFTSCCNLVTTLNTTVKTPEPVKAPKASALKAPTVAAPKPAFFPGSSDFFGNTAQETTGISLFDVPEANTFQSPGSAFGVSSGSLPAEPTFIEQVSSPAFPGARPSPDFSQIQSSPAFAQDFPQVQPSPAFSQVEPFPAFPQPHPSPAFAQPQPVPSFPQPKPSPAIPQGRPAPVISQAKPLPIRGKPKPAHSQSKLPQTISQSRLAQRKPLPALTRSQSFAASPDRAVPAPVDQGPQPQRGGRRPAAQRPAVRPQQSSGRRPQQVDPASRRGRVTSRGRVVS